MTRAVTQCAADPVAGVVPLAKVTSPGGVPGPEGPGPEPGRPGGVSRSLAARVTQPQLGVARAARLSR